MANGRWVRLVFIAVIVVVAVRRKRERGWTGEDGWEEEGLGGHLVLRLALEYGHELLVVELALLQGSLLPRLFQL
jgi:hypothetical protein